MTDNKLIDAMVTYRAKHDMSLRKFAELCGLSVQTVNSVENGLQSPSKITKKKIELFLEGGSRDEHSEA